MNSSSTADVVRHAPQSLVVEALRRQLGRLEAAARPEDASGFSCGLAAVDRLLPGGGLRRGMLMEWFGGQAGSGAATLSLLSAREACRRGRMLVVVDRRRTFYPPAAAAWGVDLERLVVVRPLSARDELWAVVQALRSPVVAAVWGAIDRADARALRRLQLAAEAGRTLGVFLRPARVRGEPTWAAVQLMVEGKLQHANCNMQIANWRDPPPSSHCPGLIADGRRLVEVRLLRGQGGRAGSSAVVEIDDAAHEVREVNLSDDAHPLPVAAQLADPTARSRSARA